MFVLRDICGTAYISEAANVEFSRQLRHWRNIRAASRD